MTSYSFSSYKWYKKLLWKPNLVLEVGIKGIINIIDFCKIKKIKEIFLASSSEVYQNAPIYPTDEKVRLIIPDPIIQDFPTRLQK